MEETNKEDTVTHEEGIVGSASSWLLTFVGILADFLPLLQFISFSLAIAISVITLYRMFKGGKGKK